MKYKLWDKKESINDVSAQVILKSNPLFENEDVVLIYSDDESISNIEIVSIIKKVSGCTSNDLGEIVSKYLDFIRNEDIRVIEDERSYMEKYIELEKENAQLIFEMVQGGLM
ncbi:hypothetical protein [Clostridium butyricum]|uniref:hypothetical protein n=1 Tax=Clostridium butyricum TaxID=1492 RepID=UPI00374F707A